MLKSEVEETIPNFIAFSCLDHTVFIRQNLGLSTSLIFMGKKLSIKLTQRQKFVSFQITYPNLLLKGLI